MILTKNYSRQVYEKLRYEVGVAEDGRLKSPRSLGNEASESHDCTPPFALPGSTFLLKGPY
jgi:hypothetical protein